MWYIRQRKHSSLPIEITSMFQQTIQRKIIVSGPTWQKDNEIKLKFDINVSTIMSKEKSHNFPIIADNPLVSMSILFKNGCKSLLDKTQSTYAETQSYLWQGTSTHNTALWKLKLEEYEDRKQ